MMWQNDGEEIVIKCCILEAITNTIMSFRGAIGSCSPEVVAAFSCFN